MPTLEAIGQHNSRVRRPLPAFVNAKADPVYIYNIYNRPHSRNLGSLGTYLIPACKPGQPYSRPLVIKGVMSDEYDQGDGNGNMGCNAMEGRKVAVDDIIGRKSYSPNLGLMTTNLEWWGVFAAQQEKPGKEELSLAKERLIQFMTLMVNDGDRLFAERDPKFQPLEVHRDACNYLGLARDWNAAPVQQTECENCGTMVKPTIARCPNCKGIVNLEKATELALKEKQFNEKVGSAPPAAGK